MIYKYNAHIVKVNFKDELIYGDIDEIKNNIDARYMSSLEAYSRIMRFGLYERRHTVKKLSVHLSDHR